MSPEDRQLLERAGVRFGDGVPGDDLFIYATLPRGWSKSTGDQDTYFLLDEQGRKRAVVYYKPAYYDRYAELNALPRFTIDIDERRADRGILAMSVYDSGSKVYTIERDSCGERHSELYRTRRREIAEQVSTWLADKYPNWRDPSSYWD